MLQPMFLNPGTVHQRPIAAPQVPHQESSLLPAHHTMLARHRRITNRNSIGGFPANADLPFRQSKRRVFQGPGKHNESGTQASSLAPSFYHTFLPNSFSSSFYSAIRTDRYPIRSDSIPVPKPELRPTRTSQGCLGRRPLNP